MNDGASFPVTCCPLETGSLTVDGLVKQIWDGTTSSLTVKDGSCPTNTTFVAEIPVSIMGRSENFGTCVQIDQTPTTFLCRYFSRCRVKVVTLRYLILNGVLPKHYISWLRILYNVPVAGFKWSSPQTSHFVAENPVKCDGSRF